MKKDAEKKIKKQPEVSAQIAYQGIRHMHYRDSFSMNRAAAIPWRLSA
jgi:hypothetical protein